MEAFWNGLLGAIIGGLVAIATQLLSLIGQRNEFRRQRREELNNRHREAVSKLAGAVAQDLASFRQQVAPLVEDGAGLALAEALGEIKFEIGVANDRMRAYSALVPDAAVRDAASVVYEAWSAYATEMSDDIVNSRARSHEKITVAASADAPIAFFSAVEQYLSRID